MAKFTSKVQGFRSRIPHWLCLSCGVVHTITKPNVCTACNDKKNEFRYFPSKREYHRYAELVLLERSGHIDEGSLECQPKYELSDNGNKRITRFDFRYTVHGRTVIEDVKTKGTDTVESRRIRALAEDQHDIKVVLI